MAKYDVRVVIEYYVEVEADSIEEAEHKGHLGAEDNQHTGSLYEIEAYPIDEEEEEEGE